MLPFAIIPVHYWCPQFLALGLCGVPCSFKPHLVLYGSALHTDINYMSLFWVGGKNYLQVLSTFVFGSNQKTRSSSSTPPSKHSSIWYEVSFDLLLSEACNFMPTACSDTPQLLFVTRTHLGKAFRVLGHFFHVIKSYREVMMYLLFKQLNKAPVNKEQFLIYPQEGQL